jgi:hypothetical protein
MKGVLVSSLLILFPVVALAQNDPASVEAQRTLVNGFCEGCHDDSLQSGGFSWTEVDLDRPEANAEQVERIIRKVRSGMMPPAGAPRPAAASLKAFASGLERRIDQAAASQPHIGAPDLHRVNRTEYRNSVRELVGIDVDVTELLPPDSRSGAFDNMADALTVTPALMQAYTRAADRISREAVGDLGASPGMSAYNVQRVANQMRHVEGTPFGTRGGLSVLHTFPADGDYTFRVDLHHWFTGNIIGSRLPEPLRDQDIEISIDGQRTVLLAIDPLMKEEDGPIVSDPIHVEAGQHRVAVAFLTKFDGPIQDQYRLIEHTLASTDIANHPQMTALPHLKTVSITGPFDVSGLAESNARQQIFTCRPAAAEDETTCAREIISRLARQAFRRPVVDIDVDRLMVPYDAGREGGDFETGIRTALQAILADPEFVFRFERVPANTQPGASFRLSDVELASRLSFFLWSSPPDDELLRVAANGEIEDRTVLREQVERMLADPRAETLATNFARQWLRLQGIQDLVPEPTIFPEYSTSLGASMRREVELFFASFMREDRDVLDLLTADYTYVDEVLARHYGLPVQQGPRFRRVELSDSNRFGLLGKAGILTMTSLANRTSPVARGKYVLEVLIGTPPPNPPAAVPAFKEAVENENPMSVRERMSEHRDNPVCSACHQIMDPIGLALENFDAIGLWRINDGGSRIDASGAMFDGTELDGPVSVRQAILDRSEAFVGSFTENLLAYGLGRVLDHRDMPTVRSIASEADREGNRFSSFVIGIVESRSFQMRVARRQSEVQ